MKDKLVKYHHKAIYYRIKKTLVALSFLIGAAVVFTVPVSIILSMNNSSSRAENDSSTSQVSDLSITSLE
ncbi:MAG: hypothetical protein WC366_00655 [Bacilli bacterium]|jgi:O-antigen ligase